MEEMDLEVATEQERMISLKNNAAWGVKLAFYTLKTEFLECDQGYHTITFQRLIPFTNVCLYDSNSTNQIRQITTTEFQSGWDSHA